MIITFNFPNFISRKEYNFKSYSVLFSNNVNIDTYFIKMTYESNLIIKLLYGSRIFKSKSNTSCNKLQVIDIYFNSILKYTTHKAYYFTGDFLSFYNNHLMGY